MRPLAAVLAACLILVVSGLLAPARAAGIVAIAAAIEEVGAETRLTFTLNAPVEARAFAIDRPQRIVLDLPAVNFQVPAEEAGAAGGVVASMRWGLFAADRARVVIDLAAPARVVGTALVSRNDGAHLLTLTLAPVEATDFAAAVAADADAYGLASLRPALAPEGALVDPRPTIVIDPGHGGIDPGAIAQGGVEEADVVLGFALALRDRLAESGRFRVLMTREADVFVPLGERVGFARRAQADLFVSVHADSLSSAPQVSGLTVYTNSDTASDRASATLAERENSADALAGLDTQEARDEVADILRELAERETRGYSHVFATTLIDQMDGVARLNKNPHRQAAFVVLRAYDVPSVLVELGYLSSRRDIALLTSREWRDRATAAMGDAVERFFAPRLADRAAAAAAVSP
ncbi:N-acetylmuramoyl-L-alanine amidase [Salinarimonas ramus]|uniref:N-acetylmuramoyl-L-alanine amidase n=1 Tax=Salinarimonas ramus TaxID=690164 RepID=A0A917Q3T9_9HYPH|nr:N-acetylmuramoyl-L-alanine amidase [Salinarimonas ramus]GGK17738.1 N-acetylmuramoyl-L-alanine amidase [Salinarimonas ramus]